MKLVFLIIPLPRPLDHALVRKIQPARLQCRVISCLAQSSSDRWPADEEVTSSDTGKPMRHQCHDQVLSLSQIKKYKYHVLQLRGIHAWRTSSWCVCIFVPTNKQPSQPLTHEGHHLTGRGACTGHRSTGTSPGSATYSVHQAGTRLMSLPALKGEVV